MAPPLPPSTGTDEFLGQPRGLLVCFLTELWERFSYYGMRAILIFYLTRHFLLGDDKAYLIYGAYSSLVYVTPVIGGMLADRYLGARKAVIFGAVLLVCGHFGMAFEGPATLPGTESNPIYLQILYLSLALIIVGVGFLKANISTIVGSLYGENDPRRDGGFTLFYMGINLGAFAASILCGWLGETYGWRYGFGLAGVGMLFGLFTFVRGQPHLGECAEPPSSTVLQAKIFAGLNREHLIYGGGVITVVAVWWLIQYQELIGQLLLGFGGITLALIIWYSFARCTRVERDRMLVVTTLILFSVLFWALFGQAGSSLNLFTDRWIDRKLFGFQVPASVFQSVNALFIICLAPLFSILWGWLAARGWEPSTPLKFALAIVQVGLGFFILVFGAELAQGNSVGLIWLVLIYLLHTTGELCLSPVGLSMVTKLSVSRVVGMMMGVWFLASAGANFIAGQIARLTSVDGDTWQTLDPTALLERTLDVYTDVGWLSIAVAAVLLLMVPMLRRGMHGIR